MRKLKKVTAVLLSAGTVSYTHLTIYPPRLSVEKIVNAGFKTLDFNFYDWVITAGSPYMEQDGDEWLYGMAAQAEELRCV